MMITLSVLGPHSAAAPATGLVEHCDTDPMMNLLVCRFLEHNPQRLAPVLSSQASWLVRQLSELRGVQALLPRLG